MVRLYQVPPTSALRRMLAAILSPSRRTLRAVQFCPRGSRALCRAAPERKTIADVISAQIVPVRLLDERAASRGVEARICGGGTIPTKGNRFRAAPIQRVQVPSR